MRGKDIIAAVMAERKLGRYDFFVSRFPEHVQARRIAIRRMADAGFTTAKISRVMGIHYDTVRYWLNPEWRKSKRQMMLDYARRRAAA